MLHFTPRNPRPAKTRFHFKRPVLQSPPMSRMLLLITAVAVHFTPAGVFTLRAQAPNPAPAAAAAPIPTIVPAPEGLAAFPLSFDATMKTQDAKAGQEQAHFTFSLTNISPALVTVKAVNSSCGCTVAKLPSQPWNLIPGESGNVQVAVDLRNKWGMLTKSITLDTSAGYKPLIIRVNIPEPAATQAAAGVNMDRQRNMLVAMNDRQAVFKGDCAKCHVDPAKGKMGKDLYVAACGVCHEGPHRAGMVPDLHNLKNPTNYEYWKFWTTSGKPNSLMPAFAKNLGGPLSPEQIESLSEYLTKNIPSRPAAYLGTRNLPVSQSPDYQPPQGKK